MLKTIVVDDERPSREALSTYIRDYCRDVEIVSECDSVKTAYKAILDHSPQLVFLDIEMPNGNGFDLLKLFNPVNFKVIFVTAYSDYAIKAFRFSATDYLLKPVKVDELVESVERVKQELTLHNGNQNIQSLLGSLIKKDEPIHSLVIPDQKGFNVLHIPDIIMCEADGYCTHFYLTKKVKITSTKNLKHYADLLEEHPFIRVHHSWLINLHHVKSYTHQGDILLSENQVCILGNSYKKGFLELFGRLR